MLRSSRNIALIAGRTGSGWGRNWRPLARARKVDNLWLAPHANDWRYDAVVREARSYSRHNGMRRSNVKVLVGVKEAYCCAEARHCSADAGGPPPCYEHCMRKSVLAISSTAGSSGPNSRFLSSPSARSLSASPCTSVLMDLQAN